MTHLLPQQMGHDEYAKKVKSEMEKSKRMKATSDDLIRNINPHADLDGILNSYSKPNINREPSNINDLNQARTRLGEIERALRAPSTTSTDVDLSVYDVPLGKMGDNTTVEGWVAPPPEYGIDPVAYHRLEQTTRVGVRGLMLSFATVLIQGVVQTPHLIETYATGSEWAIQFGGPHALILVPTLSVAAIAKSRLMGLKKRTDAEPVPLRARGNEIRKMKAIHRAGKPEHRDALTRQVYARAVQEEQERERNRENAKKKKALAAAAARQEAISKEQALALVSEAFDAEDAKRRAEQAEATRAAEQAAARAAAALENSLATATERHERIRTAYIDIITDPLNALEHASLFDVGDTRTSKFVQAYLDVEDLVNNHGGLVPTDLVPTYAQQVRDLVRLWDDALAYSKKRSYNWLPHGEADIARKAAAALARAIPADGEEITPEQIISARKALDLLDKITTVTLPKQARGAIQAVSRPEITAGSGE